MMSIDKDEICVNWNCGHAYKKHGWPSKRCKCCRENHFWSKEDRDDFNRSVDDNCGFDEE